MTTTPPRRSIRRTAAGLTAGVIGVSMATMYRGRIRRARLRPPREAASLLVQPERETDGIILIEGGVNFRDIGGYRTADGHIVRSGIVYRSGTLNTLTDAGMQTLLDRGVSHVYDLRLDEEAARNPDRIPAGIVYERAPIQAGSSPVARVIALMRHIDRVQDFVVLGYTKSLIDGEAHTFAGILNKIANEDGASVVHCTAGKDRTGIFSAVLLSALGVSDETIAADYSLSNAHYDDFYAEASTQMKPLRRLGIETDDIRDMLLADPAYMRQALAYLKANYGSADAYLIQAGVSPEKLVALKAKLLA